MLNQQKSEAVKDVTLSAPRASVPFPSWPNYAADELAVAQDVLASGKVNYWTGNQSRQFEAEYAAHIGVKHAVALMNGTVSLELALRLWGIGQGDEVIVSPRSFMASVSCAVLLGARPVFADVDPDSGNITAEAISGVITPRTRAIIPVHLGGWPCEMDAIMALAREHNLKVLEDCAQAHGAFYRARPVGVFGDASSFSFCQDKIITTAGEGGLLATNDPELWERSWSFKDHGKTWESVYEREHGIGFRWLHDRFGTNWRLTEIQAAIGRVQLRKLSHWVERRRRNAAIFFERLGALPLLRLPTVPSHIEPAYYRVYAYVRPEALRSGWSRDRIMTTIAESGVPCFVGSCSEIYRERAFVGTGWVPAEPLPVAARLGETSLAFLVHPTLKGQHIHQMCDVIVRVAEQATA